MFLSLLHANYTEKDESESNLFVLRKPEPATIRTLNIKLLLQEFSFASYGVILYTKGVVRFLLR